MQNLIVSQADIYTFESLVYKFMILQDFHVENNREKTNNHVIVYTNV